MADTKGAQGGDSIKAIALDYFKQLGWWVFPAHSVEKQPLITWKDKPRVLTMEELSSWPQWERPGVRLGALTGRRSGFFVVDADSQTAKDYLEFMKHPPCPMAKSGGDHQGLHLYFKLPDFRVKSLARLSDIDGLDIRGEGGIIMLPPSRRPDGRTYEWMISPFGNELPEAPQWLLKSLQRQNEKDDKSGVDIARLYDEGIPYGKRDTEMNRVAGYLRYIGMPLVAAKTVQEQVNKDCCQPPLERHVVVDQVWRAFNDLETGDVLGTQAFINRDGEDGEAGERPQPRIISDVELMATEFPAVKWIVPDLIPAGSMIFAGKPKLGKAQAVDSGVLTPTGWRRMGDIQVGDEVIGVDGRPTKVLQVHPQGERDLYRVEVTGGDSVEVTWDHLWDVQTHNDRVKNRGYSTRSTKEIHELLSAGKDRDTYLPTLSPVLFYSRLFQPLHPYLLGVLLGDGGFTAGTPTLTTTKADLAEEVAKVLPEYSEIVLKPSGRGIQYSLRASSLNHENAVTAGLRELGLYGSRGKEKFIPERYLRASPADRRALLRGLMDTDGSLEGATIFYTSSKDLARGFKELVEGLGGVATLRARDSGYRKENGDYKECGPGYRVTFRLPLEVGAPFLLERHERDWQQWRKLKSKEKPPLRRIEKVEYSRKGQAKCITVAAEDGLYVTEHGIVTHNSFFVFDLCLAVATGGTALGRIKVERGDVLYCALEDVERRLKARRKKILPDVKGIASLFYLTIGATIDTGFLEQVEGWLKDHPKARLVAVDTLAKVKGRGNDRQNIYDADYQTVQGLHALAGKYNVCLMLVTHTNQSRDIKDPMDLVQGSTGLTGGVDGAAVLLAGRGDAEAFLSIFHRDVESDNTEIAMKREEKGTWTYMGDAEKFRMSRQRRKILDAFSDSDVGEMYPREVADVIEEKTNAVNRVMLKMASEGVLINRYGKYRLGPSAPVTVTFGPVTYESEAEEDGI